MEWETPFPNNMVGTKIRRISGKNEGREGVIEKVFSVSGTVDVRYSGGGLGKFCNLDDFEKVEKH